MRGRGGGEVEVEEEEEGRMGFGKEQGVRREKKKEMRFGGPGRGLGIFGMGILWKGG